VACEVVAGRGRAPRGGSAFARRFWSISVTMEDSHRMSSKARRKKASSAHAPGSRPVRGAAGDHRAPGRRTSERTPADDAGARRATAAGAFIPRPSIQPRRHSAAGPAQPR
jgi:hypothetical protein